VWLPVEVDISKHVVEGRLEDAEAAHPETAVEQYMGRMASFPHFDTSRPLWDAHLLHIPRPKSASSCVFRWEHGALPSALYVQLRARRAAPCIMRGGKNLAWDSF